MKNKHIGSTLQSLFDELGEGAEFRLGAQKMAFVIAAKQRMASLKMSKNELAKRMKTSRPAIDRLLDPNNTSLTFASLNRATQALGLDFSLAFFEMKPRRGSPGVNKKVSRRHVRKGRPPASRAA
jgi:antitoxin HicB